MSAHALEITPPQSFTRSPPTPPAIEEKSVLAISRVLAEVRRHRDGHQPAAGEEWLKFTLDGHQYDSLQRQLQKYGLWDHYQHKLRYDYFPLANLYVLRMPGLLHENFIFRIAQKILGQLDTIGQGSSPSARFAREIENNASAEIHFQEAEFGAHQPDIAFQHREAQYPGVIVEVSHSQKKDELSRLAHEYLLGSDADIRVMIGIDVAYKGSKKASVSVWRPQIGVSRSGEVELCAVQTVTDQLFRDEMGNLVSNPQASLRLRLEDFGTEAFATEFPGLTGNVHISAEELFTYLENAEARAKKVKDGQGLVRSHKPWARKRRRDTTPPEQLESDREGTFAEEEQRAAKKAMRDDLSYKASSSDADHE